MVSADMEQRVEDAGRFGSFGLNCDEQAALIAKMRADKKLQRLLQVREQEKTLSKAKRQQYEQRLQQQGKKLCAQLMQRLRDKREAQLRSIQEAEAHSVAAASKALEDAKEAEAATQQADAAAALRWSLQDAAALERAAVAAQRAHEELQALHQQQGLRAKQLQHARALENARAGEQVDRWRAQQAQRAEQAEQGQLHARPPARRRHIDFRFTHIHETGLRAPPAAELAHGDSLAPAHEERAPTAEEAAEQAERRAAKAAAAEVAARRRGVEALRRARLERAAAAVMERLHRQLAADRTAAARRLRTPSPARHSRWRDARYQHAPMQEEWQGQHYRHTATAAEQDGCSLDAWGLGPAAPDEEKAPAEELQGSRRAGSTPDTQHRSGPKEASPGAKDSRWPAAGSEGVQASVGNALHRIHRCTQTDPFAEDEPEPARLPRTALPQPHQLWQPAQAPTNAKTLQTAKLQSPALTLPPARRDSKSAAEAARQVGQNCKATATATAALARNALRSVLPAPVCRKPQEGRQDQACTVAGTSSPGNHEATAFVVPLGGSGSVTLQKQRGQAGLGSNLDGLAEGLVRTLPGELSESGCSSPERPAKAQSAYSPTRLDASGGARHSTAAEAVSEDCGARLERHASAWQAPNGAPTTGNPPHEVPDAFCTVELSPVRRLPEGQPQPQIPRLVAPNLAEQGASHSGQVRQGSYSMQGNIHLQSTKDAWQAHSIDTQEAAIMQTSDKEAGRADSLIRSPDGDSGQPLRRPVLSFAQAAADLEALCALPLSEAAAPDHEPGSRAGDSCMRSLAHPGFAFDAHGSGAAGSALGLPHPHSPVSSAADFNFAKAERDLAALLEEAGGRSDFDSVALPVMGVSSCSGDEDMRVLAHHGLNQDDQQLCAPWTTGGAEEEALMAELDALVTGTSISHCPCAGCTFPAQGRRQIWHGKGWRLGSLKALAEQLQSAISDTVALTEGLLGTNVSSRV